MAVLLVVVAPLPEGSANPWALRAIQSAVFALVAIWQLAAVTCQVSDAVPADVRPLLLPVLLFAALSMVQVLPLPPAMLRAISPATYKLYAVSLPGWPGQLDESKLPAVHSSDRDHPQASILPTVDEVRAGVPVPFVSSETETKETETKTVGGFGGFGRWRPLSIAPSLSKGVLIEMAACASLFFLILLHPFGPGGAGTERRVSHVLIMAALLSGLITASVGIIEFFTWNGKILWLFVPYDWGSPQGELPRASGPFVSPDHFGNYLAMILPIALGGALFGTDRFSKHRPFRVFSGVTAFLVMCALLLSLSRAAWIAAALSLAILFTLSARMTSDAAPQTSGVAYRTALRRFGAMIFVAVLLGVVFVGPQGREQIDARLQETIQSDSGLGERLDLTAQTLAMVRDYPLVGVGLGCWPELFPHYRLPPWTAMMYREAHNDYAQLLSETGVPGFVLVGWFFIVIGRRLYGAFAKNSVLVSPALAALCGALAAMAFHEFFDFSLHTPANALLFTVILGLATRTAMRASSSENAPARPTNSRVAPLCVSALAVILIGCAWRQETIPYPYNVSTPRSVTEAVALISAHPAESAPHLDLVSLGEEQLSTRENLTELGAAVWLDPVNPYNRDAYAHALLRSGMTDEALDDVRRSVAASPSLATHFYLSERLIPWLSGREKAAVEQGLKQAIERHYDGAVPGLAAFYRAQGRFAEAGNTYSVALRDERDPKTRGKYLVGAGLAYAQGGDTKGAEGSFEEAIRNEPADARPYAYLVTLVLGPRHQLEAAQEAVAEGVREGADGQALYDALADAAQHDSDTQLAETALQNAVDLHPSFVALFRLGTFYLDEKKYGRAALTMRRAIETNPRSADAYFYLGLAEESDYRFSEAENDLRLAVRLAPTNAGYRSHYDNFEHKVAQGVKTAGTLSEESAEFRAP